jgi:hypothetical protein
MDAIDIRPGYVLPNGCTVIAASTRDPLEWIVLALNPNRTSQSEYVTWRATRPGDGSDTRHGHYHDDLQEAVTDYYNR